MVHSEANTRGNRDRRHEGTRRSLVVPSPKARTVSVVRWRRCLSREAKKDNNLSMVSETCADAG